MGVEAIPKYNHVEIMPFKLLSSLWFCTVAVSSSEQGKHTVNANSILTLAFSFPDISWSQTASCLCSLERPLPVRGVHATENSCVLPVPSLEWNFQKSQSRGYSNARLSVRLHSKDIPLEMWKTTPIRPLSVFPVTRSLFPRIRVFILHYHTK